jgi:signal transduction histidine kinase
MIRFRHRYRRPPWWPDNEPWPPAGRPRLWHRGRSRFVRRIGMLFAVMLAMSAIGVTTVVSWLADSPALSGLLSRVSLLAITVAAALVVASAVYLAAMRRVAFPLGDLVGAADRVAGGDLSTRIAERGPASLRSVMRAFNEMTARLELHEQQRRYLMAEIAHELRTPLTVIQGRLEGLLDGVYARDDARIGEVLNDTKILGRLVEDLRILANAESGNLALHREPTDLVALVHDVVGGLAGEAADASSELHVDVLSDLPPVDVDPLRIREVVSNLVLNALHHSGRDGTVTIALARAADRVTIRVSDTGVGMSAEELKRIFDRFYKRPASKGSGLGLTIARRLAIAHGGDIRAESEPGRGTSLTVTLPLAASR